MDLITDRASFQENATASLREAFGPMATFREGQLEAIEEIVLNRSRLLVVQRTGWGKSIVYLVATKLLRDRGSGPTIIISPLLALMRDQVAAAERIGVRAVTLNSSNQADWVDLEQEILGGSVDLLLVSPERLNNRDFRQQLLIPLTEQAGLFVIDEAHCISDWGHDFRPDYRRIIRVLGLLPQGVPVLCTTATANNRVVSDIAAQLGSELQISRGSLNRESLALSVHLLDSQAERLAWLVDWLPSVDGTGIVYCLTVADTERVATWLNEHDICAEAYSGATSDELRLEIEQHLRANEVKVVCATSALGMGFDKPDLAFVVHFQSPDSPVAYYQQVGRAGRAIDSAEGVLLSGAEDSEIWEWFLKSSLPTADQAEAVVAELERTHEWTTLFSLEPLVNLSQTRLEGLLKVLDVEGAVEADGRKYRRTLSAWAFDHDRIDGVRSGRLAEHDAMRTYAATSGCRMRFLRESLDDTPAEDCGRCDNCRGTTTIPPAQSLIVEALRFLHTQPTVIEPRKKWALPMQGNIPEDHRPQEGRALALLSDAGFGRELLHTKREHSLVGDETVVASAELIRQWLPDFQGTIVPVPTFDADRNLVPDFARRLATSLDLPYAEPVVKVRRTKPQKLMANSSRQISNILGAFEIRGEPPSGPVLLVDDVSDSRWTMTVIGNLLAEAGTRMIHPFAIAKVRG